MKAGRVRKLSQSTTTDFLRGPWRTEYIIASSHTRMGAWIVWVETGDRAVAEARLFEVSRTHSRGDVVSPEADIASIESRGLPVTPQRKVWAMPPHGEPTKAQPQERAEFLPPQCTFEASQSSSVPLRHALLHPQRSSHSAHPPCEERFSREYEDRLRFACPKTIFHVLMSIRGGPGQSPVPLSGATAARAQGHAGQDEREGRESSPKLEASSA